MRKWENRVNSELPREMQKAAAAAIDPADRPLPCPQFLRLAENVRPTALAAHRNQRRMFAENERRLGGIAGNLIDEAALQGQHGIEGRRAEQVDLQARAVAVRHRD